MLTILKMVENPIQNQNPKKASVHNHKYRDEHPEKFKGNAIFIIKGFKNEKDRIKVNENSEKKLPYSLQGFSMKKMRIRVNWFRSRYKSLRDWRSMRT